MSENGANIIFDKYSTISSSKQHYCKTTIQPSTNNTSWIRFYFLFELNLYYLCSLAVLYSDGDYEYYKVPVKEGVRMVEGAVSDTCQEAGLRAVCPGPGECRYTDTDRCQLTPLSTDCGWPM